MRVISIKKKKSGFKGKVREVGEESEKVIHEWQ